MLKKLNVQYWPRTLSTLTAGKKINFGLNLSEHPGVYKYDEIRNAMCTVSHQSFATSQKTIYICLLKHDKQFMEETKEQGIGGDREVE